MEAHKDDAGSSTEPADIPVSADWRKLTDIPLVKDENQYISLFSNLTADKRKSVLKTVDALATALKKIHLDPLLQTLPYTHQFVIVDDHDKFQTFTEVLLKKKVRFGWHFEQWYDEFKQGTAVADCERYFVVADAEMLGPELIPYCSSSFGFMLSSEAANSRAPYWLNHAFGQFCERLASGQNTNAAVGTLIDWQKFDRDWNKEIAAALKNNTVKSWNEILTKDSAQLHGDDLLTTYTIVEYLITTSSDKFIQFLSNARNGSKLPAALEQAYERTPADLEKQWKEWALKR